MLSLLQTKGDWGELFQYLGPYTLVIVVLLLLHKMGLIGKPEKPDFSGVQEELKQTREAVQRVNDSLLKTIHDINESRTADITRVVDSLGKLSEALNQWTQAMKK